MNPPTRHSQSGSSLGEQLTFYALVALCITVLPVVFDQSVFWGSVVLGVSLAAGLLVFAFGLFQTQREERRRETGCRADLERAAAEHNAAIEAVFFGRGEGGYAAFGVAGAARKLIHARESYQKDRTSVYDFDQLAAAFARPAGENRYRLEVRAQPGEKGSQRAILFVTVTQRDEAGRWVRALQPHLGEKVRFVETADGSA